MFKLSGMIHRGRPCSWPDASSPETPRWAPPHLKPRIRLSARGPFVQSKRHIESFEDMEADLEARLMVIGQRLAKRMKAINEDYRSTAPFALRRLPPGSSGNRSAVRG